MFKMNKKMSNNYRQLSCKFIKLNSELLEFATSGFDYKDGCYFLKDLYKVDTNVTINDFPDRTGYECFINSINIDDYIEVDYLEQSISFVKEVFKSWKLFNKDHELVSIISIDELGSKIKLHVKRDGEQWISDSLDDFEEAILVVDSSDEKFEQSNG